MKDSRNTNYDNLDKPHFLNALKWAFRTGLIIGAICLVVSFLIYLLDRTQAYPVYIIHSGAAGSMLAFVMMMVFKEVKTRSGLFRMCATAASRIAGVEIFAILAYILFF